MFNCAICQKANTDKLVGHVVHGALIHGNDKKRIVELEAQLQALREAAEQVLGAWARGDMENLDESMDNLTEVTALLQEKE
jgi:predicted lipid-binding transport protein (Tim44 family)